MIYRAIYEREDKKGIGPQKLEEFKSLSLFKDNDFRYVSFTDMTIEDVTKAEDYMLAELKIDHSDNTPISFYLRTGDSLLKYIIDEFMWRYGFHDIERKPIFSICKFS